MNTATDASVRAGPKPLSEEELNKAVLDLVKAAENFVEEQISPFRIRMMDYYNGKVDFPAKAKRSRVVRTEVRDIVEMLMPPLMAVFASVPNVVEFVARPGSSMTTEQASKSTDEVNDIFYNGNPGWIVLHDGVKDTLLNRVAVAKIYDEEGDEYESEGEIGEVDALDTDYDVSLFGDLGQAQQLDLLNVDPEDFELLAPPEPAPVPRKQCVEIVPPEELIIDQYATNADDAVIVGQRKRKRLGELLDMGFTKEDLENIKELSTEAATQVEQEKEVRTGISKEDIAATEVQWALREVVLKEVFVRIDADGSGKLKRHQVFIVGNTVLRREETKDNYQPFVIFNSIRVPHSSVGRSPGEHGKEFQDIGTTLFRQTLDNLYWSNSPAIGVLKNAVNPYQVDNWNFGSKIDQKVPNAVQVYTIPFVADKVIPFFAWLDQQREQRTGVYKDALGLNPDAIKGSTATAAAGGMAAAQRQLEMYARVIAETGIAPIFRKIYFLKYGRKPPMNTSVRVGLGTGSTIERMTALMMVAAKQEGVLLSPLGVQNGLVTLEQYGYTLNEIAKLTPYYDNTRMFESREATRRFLELKSQQPPEPSPEMAKVQGELAIKQQESQAKLQGDAMKQQQDMQIQQVKNQAELQLQHAQNQQTLALDAQKQQMTLAVEQAKAEGQMALETQKQAHNLQLEALKADHEARLREVELAAEIKLEEKRIKAQAADGQGNVKKPK